LRNDDNKTELFGFLADVCTKIALKDGKLVKSTKGTDTMDTGDVQNRNYISPYSHEADIQLILRTVYFGNQK